MSIAFVGFKHLETISKDIAFTWLRSFPIEEKSWITLHTSCLIISQVAF